MASDAWNVHLTVSFCGGWPGYRPVCAGSPRNIESPASASTGQQSLKIAPRRQVNRGIFITLGGVRCWLALGGNYGMARLVSLKSNVRAPTRSRSAELNT